MVGNPVGKRPFHVFLSHAHVDRARADQLVGWLREMAGVPVWYDADKLPPGTFIGAALADAIERSRSMILLLSETSVSRGWVQQEYNAAINHQTQYPDYRIIPVRLDGVRPPGFLQNYSSMTLGKDGLDATSAAGILKGLYQPAGTVDTANGRNVYVSRGWHLDDAGLAEEVCGALADAGLQLIGDAQDRQSWVEDRIAQIMESCGGFAAILPYRESSASRTSRYVLREWELALSRNLPSLVVPDPRIELPPDFAVRPGLATVGDGGPDPARLAEAAAVLSEDWTTPARTPYVFYATDFESEDKPLRTAVKDLVEAITVLPCLLGQYVRGESVQTEIVHSVTRSTLVLADISGGSPNVHIELGAARAADVPIHLLRHGPPARPPFMLRDKQVWDYHDDAGLLGRVLQITYPYRRTVLHRR